MKKKKTFSPEQKLAAVKAYWRRDTPVYQICWTHGISRVHLQQWLKMLDERAPLVFMHGSKLRRLGRLKKRIEKLEDDRETSDLREKELMQSLGILEDVDELS